MAHSQKPSAKNETGEYAIFQDALKRVLSVSHSELKSRMADKKRKKAKRSSASHAADDRV